MSEESCFSFGRLTHLLLGNFKAFKRTQRIPIRPITLIYGKNNSGKSSIIQALLYAEHVRRTRDFDPPVVTKDNHRVLEGGLARLIHGLAGKPPSFGWEWANTGSATGIESGKYMQQLGRELVADAALNGEEFFKLTGAEDTWVWPGPNRKHPLYRAAMATVQHWLAAEYRRWIANKEGSPEIREVLQSVCEDLDAGNYGNNIEEILFAEEGGGIRRGLQISEPVALPPTFRCISQLDNDWDPYSINPTPGYRPTVWLAGGFEHVDRWMRQAYGYKETDTTTWLSWNLAGTFNDPMTAFVSQRAAYILDRWLQDAWAHVSGPLEALIGTVHYLGAVRSRPGRIFLHEPKDISPKRDRRPGPPSPQHRGWILGKSAIEQANHWLRKPRHRKLIGNIQLDYAETPLAGTLSIYDRDRGLKLDLGEVGFGISQFLPVLLASFAQQDYYGEGPSGTLLVEEPEAHVHPALQSEIGDLFINAVTRREHPLAYVVCETHSEHLLLRIMRRIREGKLSPAKVAVLYVENLGKESIVREMPLNEKGELIRDWPGGFFEEGLRDILF